jgi:phage-related protein
MAGEDEDYGSARITIDLDDADAVADARDLGLRIQRALVRATRTTGDAIRRNIQRGLSAASVSVRVEPDMSRFDARLLDGLRSFDSINLPVAPDLTGFVERIRALLAGEEVSIRVVPDLTDLDARIRAHRPPQVTVPLDFDGDPLQRSLSSITRVAGGVLGAIRGLLTFGAVGIAAAGAAQGVGLLVAALAPAAGIMAALPAVVLGAQAAMGALRLATMGVGDAFSAALTGSAEEFADSLEDLSPAAQAAAREVRALKPAFEDLRNSVQDAFFSEIEGQITAVAAALRGPLMSGLTAISTEWGRAASGVAEYLASSQGAGNVLSILGGAEQAVGGLAAGTNELTAGVLRFAAAVSDAFGARLGDGIQSATERLGAFLTESARSGQAVAWVEAAVATFRQLGDIAGNVGSILSGVFGAADANGASFLGRLQLITAQVAEFVNSDPGQTALGAIFATVGQVAAQLGPIISALVTQLGGVAPALAPILTGLGPVLVGVINGLGAAVQGALPHLAVTFQQLGAAALSLAPALPPIAAGAAALARSGADLVAALAPAVTLLAQLLGPIVDYAAPVLVAAAATLVLVKAIAAVRVAFAVLQAAWLALNTAFVANPLGVIIVAVIGLVAAIYLLYKRFGAVRAVVDTVGRAIRDGFLAAVEFTRDLLSGLADFFVDAFNSSRAAVSSGVDAIVGFFTGLPGRITAGLSSLGSSIAQFFTSAWQLATTAVQTGITAVVNFFVALPGRIVAGLAALPGLLLEAFTSAVAYLIIGLLTVVAGIVFVFTELPGRIWSALVGLGALLISAFTAGFTAVTTTVSGWITSTVAFFRALPGRIAAALTSLGAFLLRNFVSAFNSARARATAWLTQTVAFFRALPGRIAAALSALGSFLLRNFVSAFNSARARISSFISSAVGFFRALPGRVGSALAALPGRIASAFTSAASRARSAVSSLISGVVALFRGLPGAILNAIGNIGGRIMDKVKSGLPSSVKKYLPFADGGIVYGPTHALIGEAGPEVVIPLTRPRRARQLAERSGLLGILGATATAQPRALAAADGASSAAVGKAVSSLRKALTGIGNLLDSVGRDVVLGMVEGIRSQSGRLVGAAEDMALTTVTTAQDALGIASPSKVFAKIGRDVGRGFIQGLTGTASQIKSTTEKLVRDIQNAFSGKRSRIDDRLISMLDRGNKRLTTLAAQRDALTKRIADAQKFAAETTKQALDAFSLSNLTQGMESVSAKTITAGLEDAVQRVKAYSADLNKLARQGLRKDLLGQIIGLGPVQGAQIADVLANSTKDSLKRINSLQSQLAKASGTLGNTSADVLYDAGQQAGKGFLAGLKGQRKSIEKLMLDIAKGMQSSIRAALRIKSPSRVFMKIGDLTGLGLHVGLLRRLSVLEDASRVAARSLADGVRSQLAGLSADAGDADVIPLTRAQRARRGDGGAGAAGRGRAGDGGSVVHNHHWEIREVGNAHVTAQRVLSRFVLAAGVSG